MKCFFVLAISLCLMMAVFGQPPDSLWSRTYGGTRADYGYALQPTTDGGYILGGSTKLPGREDSDFWLVKIDTGGDSIWSRTYGNNNIGMQYHDWCYLVLQTTDGGYFLAGVNDGSSEEPWSQFWCVKTNANGDSLWSRSYAASDEDYCHAVLQTADSGYLLAGNTLYTDSDFRLVKIDATGDTLWCRTTNLPDVEGYTSVQLAVDGGYILGGYRCGSDPAWNCDFMVVKTDTSGNTLWSQVYGGTGVDICRSILQTADGCYILAGSTDSFGAGGKDFWVLKIGANGLNIWSRTFGGSGDEECWSVQQTTDGGYALAGSRSLSPSGNEDFWLVKTDANGDSLWSMSFGGTGRDVCHALQQTTDGGYLLAGATNSFGAGDFDLWLVKTGPDPTAAVSHVVSSPSAFSLSAFPNPFNSSTTISFILPHASEVRMGIYDVLGRTAGATPCAPTGILSAGEHRVAFDGARMASGIYFVRMEAGRDVQMKKIMLLK